MLLYAVNAAAVAEAVGESKATGISTALIHR
jgi:hypothetical protein